MPINLNLRKKIILVTVLLLELVIGFIFLFNYYQQKIVRKTQDPDKIAVIKKENLIFPEESEFKHYYELQPGITETDSPDWLTYEVKYTYNADGLNERFDYKIEKPADTFRIVTLGDSFTFGHYVSTKDNWTEKLEDLLNNVSRNDSSRLDFEVINLGMRGFDVPYIVKRYKNIGAKYNPDLIIWFESGSGFNRLQELMFPILIDCEAETPEKYRKQHLNYCWIKAQEQLIDDHKEEVDNVIINSLDDFYAINNNKVVMFGFQEDNLNSSDLNTLNLWKLKYPKISFVFSIPSLYDKKEVLPDGHPNIDGHNTIAISIFDYLKNNLFKDSN